MIFAKIFFFNGEKKTTCLPLDAVALKNDFKSLNVNFLSGQPHQNDKKLLWMDVSKFLIVNALTGNHNLCALLPFYYRVDCPAGFPAGRASHTTVRTGRVYSGSLRYGVIES